MRTARILTNVQKGLFLVATATALTTTVWAQPATVPAGMRRETISDPVLNMTAFDVMVPTKWHFAGRLLQGTTCTPVPTPVFRATSPDGLTVLERLPRMDWSWGTGPGVGGKDCLDLKQEMTAEEFAKYVAKMLKTEYVADDPFPAELMANLKKASTDSAAANAARYRAAGMNPPTEHTDMARVLVKFNNGTFMMKGQISVSTYCTGFQSKGFGPRPGTEKHSCTADIRFVHAPEAQYEAMVKMLQSAGASKRADWNQAWIDQNNRQTAANIQAIRQQGARDIAQSTASHEQFMQSQAARQKTHEAFMASMQRGTDMSMNRTQQAMNARSTAASNVVDYALDQQTVRDPNSGQVNKVSSSYSYTWVDSTGKTGYQTNDPNANPNGYLKGDWTRQQVVNGDGTQKP